MTQNSWYALECCAGGVLGVVIALWLATPAPPTVIELTGVRRADGRCSYTLPKSGQKYSFGRCVNIDQPVGEGSMWDTTTGQVMRRIGDRWVPVSADGGAL